MPAVHDAVWEERLAEVADDIKADVISVSARNQRPDPDWNHAP